MAFLDLLLKIHEEDDTFTLDDVKEEVDTFMFEVIIFRFVVFFRAQFYFACNPSLEFPERLDRSNSPLHSC